MKRCTKCGVEQELDRYSPHKTTLDRRQSWCKACVTANTARWLADHPGHRLVLPPQWKAEHPEYGRAYLQKLRGELIAGYGGKCACCGESRYEFMALDHIHNGRGNPADRTETGVVLWNRLKREGWPVGEFQILCHNCNMAKGIYGDCTCSNLEPEM